MANAATWFVDRHLEEGRGDKVAFREASRAKRSLTYGELAARSDQVAGAFGRAGIGREARAAMFVLDQIEFPQIFWGALKAGVVPVPVNTLLVTDVYASILQDSRAVIVFVSEALVPVIMPAIAASDHVNQVVVIGGAPEGTVDFDTFIDGAEPAGAIDCFGDEVAFWLYSSGSTGAPKGARHVHDAMKTTCDTYAAQVLGIEETDTVYSAAKLFFA